MFEGGHTSVVLVLIAGIDPEFGESRQETITNGITRLTCRIPCGAPTQA